MQRHPIKFHKVEGATDACAVTYVGKTTGPFKWHFALAKMEKGKQINLNKPVVVHFVTNKHQAHKLRGMVFEHVKQPMRGGGQYCTLSHCEAFWMYIVGDSPFYIFDHSSSQKSVSGMYP